MNKTGLLLISFIFVFLAAYSQGNITIPKKKYVTKQLSGSITLDGIPEEEAWNAVEWGGEFIQWQPNENVPPSQQTNFKILYDERFLYIAYRCHDLAAEQLGQPFRSERRHGPLALRRQIATERSRDINHAQRGRSDISQ